MATTHGPRSTFTGKGSGTQADPRPLRWTKEEYYRLDRLGFFQDRRVELIGGEIILMTVNPPHCTAVNLTLDAIRAALGPGLCLRSQATLDLGPRSQVQPDIAVLRGDLRDYATAHPTTALLVIEVSESTLRYDRLRKMRLYARAGIDDYWIVNLIARQVEIHRNPGPDPIRPRRFRYADMTIVPATGHASPLAAPAALIAVADLLA